jgi:hypothetical protein
VVPREHGQGEPARSPLDPGQPLLIGGQAGAFVAAWHELAAVFLSLKAPPHWGTLLRGVHDPHERASRHELTANRDRWMRMHALGYGKSRQELEVPGSHPAWTTRGTGSVTRGRSPGPTTGISDTANTNV